MATPGGTTRCSMELKTDHKMQLHHLHVRLPRRVLVRRASSLTPPDKYDISDDEGDSSGRISPRTFRLWATGLSSHEYEHEHEHKVRSEQETAYLPVRTALSDDDAASSAAQPGLTDDDSTWSSETESLARSKWNHILQWQNKMPNPRPDDGESMPFRLPGQVITLSNHDIISALSHPSAPPLLAHVPLPHIHSALRLRYQLLLDSRQAETHMTELKAEVQARIDRLLTTTPEDIPPTRTEHDEEQAREQRYREEIYRHVEGHLGDVARLYLASQDSLRALADEVDGLIARERILRRGVAR
ncbi:hypothetical protein E4U43_007755 [Claviceps pusilla]|uniref:Uncharacterized protein n=1 Tax=Claviceps pusilla TaxID=123648 RepID=A0A9P7T1B3_9HYPO|nr:hypothetical protein E4U43_007755 [Claviceps pusilla]